MPEKAARDQLRVPVESLIITLRGQRVILDSDLARIYGVKTGALNRAVKRNLGRFPEDFVFQLTAEETNVLRCQSGTSKGEVVADLMKTGRGGRRYLPYAFTEHGALMAANVRGDVATFERGRCHFCHVPTSTTLGRGAPE